MGHCLEIVSKAHAGLYTFLKIEYELLNIHEAVPDVEVNEVIDELVNVGNEFF